MSQNRNVIAIIVEAEDATTAKTVAALLLTDHLNHEDYSGKVVDYIQPCPIISSEADALLTGFWQTMRDGYVECIKTILGAIALAEGDSDALLESTDFRRACAQVGSVEGRHILIYGPVMDPIIAQSNIQELRHGLLQEGGQPTYDPFRLWVVAMEITE